MAKVRVKLPLGVTYPDPPRELECEGATIAEVVKAAIAAEPRLESRIYKDGKLFVGVFVNDRNMNALGGLDDGRLRRRRDPRPAADRRRLRRRRRPPPALADAPRTPR